MHKNEISTLMYKLYACKNIEYWGFFFILESKWFVNFIHNNPSKFPKGLPFLLLKKLWTTWIVSFLGGVAWKAETEVPK